jgi:hypothetical protein
MKKLSLLIYRCCRLRSAVAIHRGEIKGANAAVSLAYTRIYQCNACPEKCANVNSHRDNNRR